MIDGVSLHRVNQRDVVHQLACPGQQIADVSPALALPGKSPMRGCDWEARLTGGHTGQRLVSAYGIGKIFIELARERRLVIPQVHLRWSARHEEIDCSFCLRRKIGQTMRASTRS